MAEEAGPSSAPRHPSWCCQTAVTSAPHSPLCGAFVPTADALACVPSAARARAVFPWANPLRQEKDKITAVRKFIRKPLSAPTRHLQAWLWQHFMPCLNGRRRRFTIIIFKPSSNNSTYISLQIHKLVFKNAASFIL